MIQFEVWEFFVVFIVLAFWGFSIGFAEGTRFEANRDRRGKK